MTRGSAWPRILTAVDELRSAIRTLQADYPTTLELLKAELHGYRSEGEILFLLRLMEPEYTAALIPELVGLATSHTYAGWAREVLGMLPHDDAVNLVAPAALRMLEPPDEFPYDTYRRMAELLDHLGLDAALRELVERAKASDDPDIQEVAEDYGETGA